MSTANISEKEARFKLENLAAPRALNDSLPGPLQAAFMDEPINVGGIQIRSVKAGDWIILKQLNSPIYQMTLDGGKDDVPFTDEEGIELIFMFTKPAKEIRAMLAKGRDQFRETAIQELADKYEPPFLIQLSQAVREQLTRYYSTMIKYASENNVEPDRKIVAEVNFPKPEVTG